MAKKQESTLAKILWWTAAAVSISAAVWMGNAVGIF